jgi:hypothetical protein
MFQSKLDLINLMNSVIAAPLNYDYELRDDTDYPLEQEDIGFHRRLSTTTTQELTNDQQPRLQKLEIKAEVLNIILDVQQKVRCYLVNSGVGESYKTDGELLEFIEEALEPIIITQLTRLRELQANLLEIVRGEMQARIERLVEVYASSCSDVEKTMAIRSFHVDTLHPQIQNADISEAITLHQSTESLLKFISRRKSPEKMTNFLQQQTMTALIDLAGTHMLIEQRVVTLLSEMKTEASRLERNITKLVKDIMSLENVKSGFEKSKNLSLGQIARLNHIQSQEISPKTKALEELRLSLESIQKKLQSLRHDREVPKLQEITGLCDTPEYLKNVVLIMAAEYIDSTTQLLATTDEEQFCFSDKDDSSVAGNEVDEDVAAEADSHSGRRPSI